MNTLWAEGTPIITSAMPFKTSNFKDTDSIRNEALSQENLRGIN
jgi:hypothetical protein